jgi:hypothetical protein
MGDRAQRPPQGGLCISTYVNLMQSAALGLRTRFYVDGYNLYYGCLKRSIYKWLDVRMLIERILVDAPNDRNGTPVAHRFVSPAVKYFTAPILKRFAKSPDSISCQAQYHNALIAHLGDELKMIKGYDSQLPTMVRRHHNVVHKPLSWYPRPDLLIPVFEEAKRVRGSAGAARKWLNQPCSHLGNRIPIEMCEQDDTARKLREYMERYAQDFGPAQIQSDSS